MTWKIFLRAKDYMVLWELSCLSVPLHLKINSYSSYDCDNDECLYTWNDSSKKNFIRIVRAHSLDVWAQDFPALMSTHMTITHLDAKQTLIIYIRHSWRKCSTFVFIMKQFTKNLNTLKTSDIGWVNVVLKVTVLKKISPI